jgi:uncharacterized protein
MKTSNEKNTATALHLSTLTQYFIPLGNYIFPIILWTMKKKDSEYIDYNGKQVLNFQLSLFLYTLVLSLIAIPIVIYIFFKNIPFDIVMRHDNFMIDNFSFKDFSGIGILAIIAIAIVGFLKVIEFVLTIYAAVKASNGEEYKYPLSIPFFK